MRDGGGKIIDTDIQQESIDRRWIDSSEPIEDWDMLPDADVFDKHIKEIENAQS